MISGSIDKRSRASIFKYFVLTVIGVPNLNTGKGCQIKLKSYCLLQHITIYANLVNFEVYLILLTRPLLVKFYLWTPANFVWLIWKKNFCLVLSIVNCRLIVDWFWFWFWLSSIKLGFICRWPLAKSKKKLFFLKKKIYKKVLKIIEKTEKTEEQT